MFIVSARREMGRFFLISLNGGAALVEGGASAREKKCEHRGGRFGARGAVLGVASTRVGGFVLAGRFLAWRAPGDVFWCSRGLSVWLALRRRHRSEKKLFGILALLRGG